MVKDINGRYNLSYNTGIPGFLPTPSFVGLDMDENYAPGSEFVLRKSKLSDENGFKRRALDNGWYSRSQFLNDPIVQTQEQNPMTLDLQ